MKNLFLLPALFVSLGLIAATTDCLHAATFNVTTANISGPGSLPVAIAQANATPGRNQIKISVTNVITLGLQLPTITNSVAIAGIAAVPSIISGGGALPLFAFAAGTTNSLSNLVLANGYTTNSGAAISNASILSVSSCVITNHDSFFGSGGAIINSGVMTISSSVISGNQADTGSGGAVYNSGTMALNKSQSSDNRAGNGGAIFNAGTLAVSIFVMSNNLAEAGFGGGIYNTGALSVSQSTFLTNTAKVVSGIGGALFIYSGTVAITNSTFCQNVAGEGGAVEMQSGSCILVNCTIANNLSSVGGGISVYNTVVSLINTIVAGNSASSSSPDLKGAFVSSGVNLIGNNQGATGLSLFDFQNVAANLGPLQNNGGPTLTCAPLPGSYAIGYGTSAGAPTTDQRGVPRPPNGAYDIGAVQTVTNSPYLMSSAFIKGVGFTLDSIFDASNKYRIQSSTNLAAWIDLYTNTSSGVLHFTDTTATNLSRRFYRTAKP